MVKLLKVSDMVVCVVTSVLCLSGHKYAISITAMLIMKLPCSIHNFSQICYGTAAMLASLSGEAVLAKESVCKVSIATHLHCSLSFCRPFVPELRAVATCCIDECRQW